MTPIWEIGLVGCYDSDVSKPLVFDYEKPSAMGPLAIAALVVGLTSGPVTLVSTYFIGESAGYAAPLLGSALAIFIALIAIVFCSFVLIRLQRFERQRGQILAKAGIVAAIGWAAVVIAFMQWVSRQLE